jgi:hypothetical protein
LEEKNKDKLAIHETFKNNISREERFKRIITSYDFYKNLESLEYLNLMYLNIEISNIDDEIDKDKCYLEGRVSTRT